MVTAAERLAAIRARAVEAPVPTRAEWREFMGGQITDAQWHEFQHSWYREQFPIARDDVRRMADALDAVLALHRPTGRLDDPWCPCQGVHETYPCPTVAAITDALGGAP